MPTVLHLDYETFSAVNLKKYGAYRYAACPLAEILLMAVAIGEADPMLFVPEMYETDLLSTSPGMLERVASEIEKSDTVIYAHNATFEIAITKYLWVKTFGKDIPMPRLEQWRCTQAMARRAALPASLENIGAELELTQQKDKRGSSLIGVFCSPRKPTKLNPATRIYPFDSPQDFKDFGAYCVQDVIVERQVHKALHKFDVQGSPLDTWQIDKRINDRGVPINVTALQNAKKIVFNAKDIVKTEFHKITGLMPSQRDKVLEWLQENGYPGKNLQAGTMEKYIEDETWGTKKSREALRLREAFSYAGVAKIDSMLGCECGDGYVRGTLKYYGAFRTGRWAGQLIQPQNFKRPSIKDTDIAYQMIQDGCTAEELYLVHGNPIEVVSSCIRHFIQPHPYKAKAFFDADYAGVEARIVCWLAGQEDALQEFRDNVDVYIRLAASIFEMPEEKISKDGIERFVGKQAVLGCGFQMGAPAFRDTCIKYGQDIPIEMAEIAVETFREVRNKVARLWPACDKAAKQAIQNPGKWFRAGDKLAFARTTVQPCGIDYLVMRLPSGRTLAYPRPAIEMVEKFGKMREQITFYGLLPGKKVKWGRISTYGGKLVENATQATAADFMGHGAHIAEQRGFEICALVHDEAIAYEHPTLTIDDFVEALTTLPDWAEGMPLAAEGKIIPYYLKA
jgi:DNA polymerase